MSGDDSRLASVLGELADLGRRISERAAELAGLMGEPGVTAPGSLADRVADVRSSVADLAAAAAVVSESTAPDRTSHAADAAGPPRTGVAAKRPGSRRAKPAQAASTGSAPPRRRTTAPAAPAGAGRPGLRRIMPAAVSVGVNLAVIVGLAVMFVAAEAKPRPVAITIGTAEEVAVDELMPVELAADTAPAAEAAAEPLPDIEALAVDSAVVDDVPLDEAAFAVDPTAVTPVSFDAADMLATVGGSGGAAAGTGGGAGEDGGGSQGAASFFGRSGAGQSVCFVCDNSNSYRNGGFHTVLDEVARAVDSLQPGQSFFVVFFSDAAYPMFHPEPVDSLQAASAENKRRLRAWLSTVEMCNGGQGIHDAVKLVGGLGADVVYFLSDGDHVPSVVDRVAAADFGGAVVHTFGMQQGVVDGRTGRIDPDKVRDQQDCDRKLFTIATAHGGTFTPVIVPPQAAALERLRPITKNRERGPVWGTRL
ncbi:MAG: hypothetical protein ACKO4Z_09595 [Planctomycetota bacterium]